MMLWSALYAVAALRADDRIRAAKLAIHDSSLKTKRWFYILAPPFVALLYQWNLIASLLSRNIEWKGLRYKMVGPNETVIEGSRSHQ